MKKIVLIVFIIAALCVAYGYFVEPNRLVLREIELKIKNWNPYFNGLKIVAIADIHGGSNHVTEEKIREIVRLTNEQNADLIVLLGDYVSQRHDDRSKLKMPMETVAENLKGLRAKYGVFAVLGNHDGEYSEERAAAELRRVGIRVLQNEVAAIEKDGRKIRILGLKDQLTVAGWKDFSDEMKEVLRRDNQTGDIIVLEHSPDIVYLITNQLAISPDTKLLLAGHTHGGQVWFPVLGSPFIPSTYGQKFAFGHTKENNLDVFVTSGVGTSMLPFRFLMPPEIAVITINAE